MNDWKSILAFVEPETFEVGDRVRVLEDTSKYEDENVMTSDTTGFIGVVVEIFTNSLEWSPDWVIPEDWLPAYHVRFDEREGQPSGQVFPGWALEKRNE